MHRGICLQLTQMSLFPVSTAFHNSPYIQLLWLFISPLAYLIFREFYRRIYPQELGGGLDPGDDNPVADYLASLSLASIKTSGNQTPIITGLHN